MTTVGLEPATRLRYSAPMLIEPRTCRPRYFGYSGLYSMIGLGFKYHVFMILSRQVARPGTENKQIDVPMLNCVGLYIIYE